MAVEYIDSPNAGFIKLGEGVDLSTITPQQKRKIKRGDRGIFPITPTGAESYERPDFKAQEAFSTPASAIPNVFDRYRTLPGGARAGGFPGGSFEDVISPGIGNQNDDANDDDEDLEEELRRQTLDVDPVGDYDLSRYDPNSPNFDPTVVGQQAYAEVLTGGDFLESVNRLTGLDSTTPTSAIAATATFAANQQLQLDKSRLAALIEKTKGSVRDRLQKELDNVNAKGSQIETANAIIGKTGAAPTGVPTTVPEQPKDYRGLTALDRALLGGTGIPKVSFGSSAPAGAIPSGLLDTGFTGAGAAGAIPSGLLDTGFTGAGGAPTVGSVEGDLSLSGIDVDITPEPTGLSTDFEGGGDQAALDAFFSGSFGNLGAKDGGKISFMNIKK